VVRPESPDPAVLLHGVLAEDRSEALVAHVQLDEPGHNRGVFVRVPGLDPSSTYDLAWEGPVDLVHVSASAPLPPSGPTDGVAVTGAALGRRGFWVPRRRPETVTLVRLARVD
jgi:alpha-galactosidase